MRPLHETMSKTRHILAVVAVTTALCADGAVSAAPVARPQVAEMAARLVDRLSKPFRQSVSSVVHAPARQEYADAQPQRPQSTPAPVLAVHCDLSPFQFRLPPPAL